MMVRVVTHLVSKLVRLLVVALVVRCLALVKEAEGLGVVLLLLRRRLAGFVCLGGWRSGHFGSDGATARRAEVCLSVDFYEQRRRGT